MNMTEDKESDESINIRDRLIEAMRKDNTEYCEELLREIEDIEATFWERFEIHMKQPIFYFAAIEQAWKTATLLITRLSKNRFAPFDYSLGDKRACKGSKGKRFDQTVLKISGITELILRPKTQLETLSCEEKLQESLVLLLKNSKISLIEKFLCHLESSDTQRMLISTTKNELGNFLLHAAARSNLIGFFKYVLPYSNPEAMNLMGETALHLAAEGGCLEAVRILMEGKEKDNNSVIYMRDVEENTPLHSSVKTRHPKLEIVSLLVKAYENQLKSTINKLGRSPLHVVAIHMSSTRNDCINVIQELRAFDPNAVDFEEETALHIAAKKRNFTALEAMLEVFYGLHRDIYRHKKDKDGYSLLDICAMNADSEMVALLLDYGADPRDGVLYHLVSESVRVPERSNDLVKIYRSLLDQADKWSRYRSTDDHMVESVFRKAGMICSAFVLDFKRHTSDNIIKLLNQDERKQAMDLMGETQSSNLSVIEHAVDIGAVDMLEAFLHTEHLYEELVKTSGDDVTYRFMVQNCLEIEHGWSGEDRIESSKRSLIERIANHDDETIAARMFNIEPLRSMVNDHIMLARIFYGLLTIAQIIYMAFFTIYHIPNVCRFDIGRGGMFNDCNVSNTYYQNQFSDRFADKSTTCAYVIWPLLLLTIAIFFNIKSTFHDRKWTEWLDVWKYSFPGIVIVWLCIFQNPMSQYDNHVACTALVFIIGWLHVFYFISFFKRFNIFALLLKEIILKDFVNFVVLMAILLLSFSCAIITLYQTPIPGTYSYRSLTGTAYRAFFDTLSPGTTFLNETTNTNFQSLGGKLHLLRIVIVIYEILTFVILLNILIAMMNDTYSKQVANVERIARLCLIKHGINLRGWWPFDRQVNDVYLPEELVKSIIRPKNVSKKRRSLWQDIHGYVKPKMKFLPQSTSRSVLHD